MTPSPFTTSPYYNVAQLAEAAVLEAAAYLENAATSGERLEVNLKADKTMVMNLDLESQRRILAVLPTEANVVAEEDEGSHGLINTAESYFLVDPLDGTTSCKRFFGQKGGHVGYGPLVGYVHQGELVVASFYNVPLRKLFTAVAGCGTFSSSPDFLKSGAGERNRLQPQDCSALVGAGVLFFIGHNGESRVIQHFRNNNALENMYRFGGFANDCARLARGHEQLSMQFTVKPWDFSAVLLPAEAGLEVWLDPLGKRTPLKAWRIQPNNPLMIMQPGIRDEVFALLDRLV